MLFDRDIHVLYDRDIHVLYDRDIHVLFVSIVHKPEQNVHLFVTIRDSDMFTCLPPHTS